MLFQGLTSWTPFNQQRLTTFVKGCMSCVRTLSQFAEDRSVTAHIVHGNCQLISRIALHLSHITWVGINDLRLAGTFSSVPVFTIKLLLLFLKLYVWAAGFKSMIPTHVVWDWCRPSMLFICFIFFFKFQVLYSPVEHAGGYLVYMHLYIDKCIS